MIITSVCIELKERFISAHLTCQAVCYKETSGKLSLETVIEEQALSKTQQAGDWMKYLSITIYPRQISTNQTKKKYSGRKKWY